MIRKPRSYSLKSNFFVVVLAMMLIAIIFAMKDSDTKQDSLKADILSLKEDQAAKVEDADMFYSVTTWTLTVYTNKSFEALSGIDMKILFDDEKVSLANKNISSSFDFDIQKDTWIGTIKFKDIGNLNKNQTICLLSFSWNQNDIVLWEVTIVKANGEKWNPSIWRK